MKLLKLTDTSTVLALVNFFADVRGPIWPVDAERIDFAEYGYARISELPAPLYDASTQYLVPGPVEQVDDGWSQGFVVVNYTSAERAEQRAEAARGAAMTLLSGLQGYMNGRAAERLYDSIHSAALRASYPGPYREEGIAYGTWMDTCLAHAYSVIAEAAANDVDVPTLDDLIGGDEFPELVLPIR
jgi:hypothetical protein